MLPPPAPVSIKMPLINVTSRRKEITLLVVVMLPPRELFPKPLCVNPPTAVMLAPFAVVNTPALFTVIVVPTRLDPTPLMFKA